MMVATMVHAVICAVLKKGRQLAFPKNDAGARAFCKTPIFWLAFDAANLESKAQELPQ